MKFGTDQLSVASMRGTMQRTPGMAVRVRHFYSGGGGQPREGKLLIMGYQCFDNWYRAGTNSTLASLELVDAIDQPTWRCYYCGGNVECHLQSSYLNRV